MAPRVSSVATPGSLSPLQADADRPDGAAHPHGDGRSIGRPRGSPGRRARRGRQVVVVHVVAAVPGPFVARDGGGRRCLARVRTHRRDRRRGFAAAGGKEEREEQEDRMRAHGGPRLSGRGHGASSVPGVATRSPLAVADGSPQGRTRAGRAIGPMRTSGPSTNGPTVSPTGESKGRGEARRGLHVDAAGAGKYAAPAVRPRGARAVRGAIGGGAPLGGPSARREVSAGSA